jgi:hypothetical protein
VNALIDHWPLVAGLGVGLWWLFPRALKDTLNNGGGEIIRRIVNEENQKQTVAHARELDDRFRRHEEAKDRRFRTIEDEVFPRRRSR